MSFPPLHQSRYYVIRSREDWHGREVSSAPKAGECRENIVGGRGGAVKCEKSVEAGGGCAYPPRSDVAHADEERWRCSRATPRRCACRAGA